MKILFYPYNCTPFHGHTLEEKPLGGVETGVIRLARALDRLGHDVTVLTTFPRPPTSCPRYIPIEKAKSVGEVDLLIAVRSWEAFWDPLPAKKRLLWTGDSYTNSHTFGLGDPRIVSLFDTLLCVSNWQAKALCKTSGFPTTRVFILRNGIDLNEFMSEEKRVRKRLIYTSNPQRGLVYLPIIFLRLKMRHPELELHIFSNAALFDMQWPPLIASDPYHLALLNIFRDLPDCHVRGTHLQNQLAKELKKSAVFAYPCNVLETSCISVMEAQAAGCAVVTSGLGALQETVDNGGIVVDGEPGSDIFLDTFTESVHRILKDDNYFHELSEKALKQSQENDWSSRAKDLIDYVQKTWSF